MDGNKGQGTQAGQGNQKRAARDQRFGQHPPGVAARGGASSQQQSGTADDPGFDPWEMYGGNIAAACRATNDAVVEQKRNEGNDEDEEKQRQRANSRLTAWQSRERKRIEFEVLQERQADLLSRNGEIKKENDQLRIVIERLNAAKSLGLNLEPFIGPRPQQSAIAQTAGLLPQMAGAAPTAALNAHMSAGLASRIQHTENLLLPLAGVPPRADMSSFFAGIRNPDISMMLPRQNQQARLPGSLNQPGLLAGNDVIAPTVFAPLQRQLPHQQHHQQQQQQQQQYQQQQQHHHQQQQQMIHQQLQQPRQPNMHALPPLNPGMAAFMTSPDGTIGPVGVPLIRAVSKKTKRKADSGTDDSTSPKKQARGRKPESPSESSSSNRVTNRVTSTNSSLQREVQIVPRNREMNIAPTAKGVARTTGLFNATNI